MSAPIKYYKNNWRLFIEIIDPYSDPKRIYEIQLTLKEKHDCFIPTVGDIIRAHRIKVE